MIMLNMVVNDAQVPQDPEQHPESFHSRHGTHGTGDSETDAEDAGGRYPGAHPGGLPNAGGGPLDLGSLLSGILGNLAGVARASTAAPGGQYGSETPPYQQQQQRQQQQQQDSSSASGSSDSERPNVRSGTTQFGPFGFQWHFESGPTGTGQATGRGSANFASRPPDDGMGGAGGASDGRPFDYGGGEADMENPWDSEHQRPSASFTGPHAPGDGPPDLMTLRGVFANLFGAAAGGGGPEGAADPLGVLSGLFGGAAGGSGRFGDYVFGQQGLDDVISQIMEQTQGSSAPPPASAEAIEKLQRVKVGDTNAAKTARNRECPTCLDAILPSTTKSTPAVSRRASLTTDDVLAPAQGSRNDVTPVAPSSSATEPATASDPPDVDVGLSADDDNDEPSDTLVILPCRHVGHEDCIVPWLQRNGTCPICREPLERTQESSSTSTGRNAGQGRRPGTEAQAQQQQRQTDPYGPSNTPHYGTATAFGELEDTDEELDDAGEDDDAATEYLNDSPEERRKRMREAAERRAAGGGGGGESSTSAGMAGQSSRSVNEGPFDLD